jgi:hypothetical protein
VATIHIDKDYNDNFCFGVFCGLPSHSVHDFAPVMIQMIANWNGDDRSIGNLGFHSNPRSLDILQAVVLFGFDGGTKGLHPLFELLLPLKGQVEQDAP